MVCVSFYLLILERNTDLLFQLFMQPLIDSYMCPDWGSNPKPGYNQLSYPART